MTRISQAPGGTSTLVFGDEGPTSPSARGPPASPRAAGTSSTSAPPAPPAVPTAPAQAPTAAPAQAPTPAPTQPVSELEAVKLKVISAIGQLQTLTPEATELIQGFLEKLPQTGCRTVPVVDADEAMERLRTTLKQRGTHGILSLGKKFKSMDDDGDNKLSFNEFHKALVEMSLPEADVHRLFRHFDADCNGYLSYDEVLVGLRGSLSPKRLDMVQRAFKVLDKSGDGQVTLDDFKGRYDASRHPDVLLGTKTQDQVLTELMEVFEPQGGGTKGDSTITLDEFKKYYEAVSASIDLDDYFELVIRNAWHISGGEGWCANTTCKRVLVLHEDGSQSVQEVQDDLDVASSQYLQKLKDQGVTNIKSIALYGEPADVPAGKASEQQALGTPPTSPQPATGSGRFSHKKPGGADHFRSSIMFG